MEQRTLNFQTAMDRVCTAVLADMMEGTWNRTHAHTHTHTHTHTHAYTHVVQSEVKSFEGSVNYWRSPADTTLGGFPISEVVGKVMTTPCKLQAGLHEYTQ